jgi:hypothetical protein
MPVVVVGTVSGQPENTPAGQLRVEAAGSTWTLVAPADAVVLDPAANRIAIGAIQPGQWVRAIAEQTDENHLRVIEIRSLGAEEAYRKGPFFRKDRPRGYLQPVQESVKGARVTSLRGTVVSANPKAGFFILRDATGREHRIRASAGFASQLKIGEEAVVQDASAVQKVK